MGNERNEINEKESIYKAADFFMLRTPLLSVDTYKKIFCQGQEEDLYELVSGDATVREALLASSLSLYNEIKNNNIEKNDRKRGQIVSSLVKYMTRMTTRTTPFGLFSGVARGSFGDSNEIKLKHQKENIKRARVDMEWLYAVLRRIETNEEVLDEICIMKNQLSIKNGTRLEIGYISNYGQLSKEDDLNNITASIRNTNQVQRVMELAKTPIKYKDILAILKENNPNTDVNRIKIFLNQLLANEYLITEMRPPLVNADPFEYILSKLEKFEIDTARPIYDSLLEIKVLIDGYNHLAIGEGEELYLQIVDIMKSIAESKNYLQIDMALAGEKIILEKSISQEVEKVMELALKLSPDRGKYSPAIEKYMGEFLEVYGPYREVALLELLDEGKGLGAPAGYAKPMSRKSTEASREGEEEKNIQRFLKNKVLRGLLDQQKEVIITDEEIQKIETKYAVDDLPYSLEVYTLLSYQQETGEYQIHLGPNIGSHMAGKTFGRFIDIMPEKIKEDLIQLEKQQEKLYKEDTIVAEIIELPQSGRLSNVAMNWSPRDYEIVLATNNCGTKASIDISDLYVGVDTEHNEKSFYIKCKSLDKRVIIKANNMLNTLLCSNIYRFLIEISSMNKRSTLAEFYSSLGKCFKDMYYTPRIKYSRSVIFPATWKLDNEVLNFNTTKYTKEDFYSAIDGWRNQWKVPQFVYLQENDNRLLLNLNNNLHVDELYSILSKKHSNSITITEIEAALDDRLVEGADGKYCSEVVIPLVRNLRANNNELKINGNERIGNKVFETKSEYATKKHLLDTLDEKRTFFPGDEWLSIKIYGNAHREDEFIGQAMLPFCNELINQKEIDQFFFLRYADPEKHTRLRLKASKEQIQNKVIPKVNYFLKSLSENGMLNSAYIDTYKREVERYGGPELIELAEEIFYRDSEIVAHLINMIRGRQLSIPTEVLVVASIINMMDELKIDYEVQKEIFMERIDKAAHRDVFQQHRKTLLTICNSSGDWGGLRSMENGNVLYKLFEMRRNALNNYGYKMKELDEAGQLWNDKISMLFAIIHMHCNRLMGSRQKETVAMALVRHTLHALEYVKKNKGQEKAAN